MKMYCQRHRLRLAFTRVIATLQTESKISSSLGIGFIRWSSSAWHKYFMHLRQFSSESDWPYDDKTKDLTKEISEDEIRCEDYYEQVSLVNEQNSDSNTSTSFSHGEKHLEASLSVLTDEQKLQSPALKTIAVVPGKGPPPEPPITCCMTGCANCVWIMYAEELRDYYKDGGEQAKLALEKIEDPSLRAFVKLELGL